MSPSDPPVAAPTPHAETDDLGLSLDMLDADRLRDWARLLLVHGADISHWGSVPHVARKMQILATNIEQAVRDIGKLRQSRVAAPPPETPEALNADGESLHIGDDERIDCVTNIRAALEEAIEQHGAMGEDVDGLRSALEDCDSLDALLIATIQRERVAAPTPETPELKEKS